MNGQHTVLLTLRQELDAGTGLVLPTSLQKLIGGYVGIVYQRNLRKFAHQTVCPVHEARTQTDEGDEPWQNWNVFEYDIHPLIKGQEVGVTNEDFRRVFADSVRTRAVVEANHTDFIEVHLICTCKVYMNR